MDLFIMICRSCHSSQISSIISFGNLPLANRLMRANQLTEHEPTYNLEIILCHHCTLVQLKDTIDPDVLFSEYHYFSSNSETMLQSAVELVDKIIPTLDQQATIIEIASNDGYLLKNYVNKNFTVIGIEPAKNIADYANANNIPTLTEFFTKEFAEQLVKNDCLADIIHANNVMAHVRDIHSFVSGIKTILKTNGRAIIEVPYLLDLINKNEFDTIYHEHVYYFSLTALVRLFAQHNLTVYDVERLSIHGGSLRLFIGHPDVFAPSLQVQNLLDNELRLNIDKLLFYESFIKHIADLKIALSSKLQLIKNQNKKIVAYGASAKGTTLLNFFKLGKELIDFVVDRSPVKQGYFTPGTHLEIKPVESLLNEQVDYALLLTWNFAEEILRQQQIFRDQGGKFIIPIPVVEEC